MALVLKIAAGVFLVSPVVINGSLIAVVLLLSGLALVFAAAVGLAQQRHRSGRARKSPLTRA